MHLGDPVPQRIHDKLQYVRMRDVKCIAGTGVVGISTPTILQPVVVIIADTAEGKSWP